MSNRPTLDDLRREREIEDRNKPECKEHDWERRMYGYLCRKCRLYSDTIPDRPICGGCKQEIDPDCCHCGSPMELHTWGDGHSPVPMGCICGYHK